MKKAFAFSVFIAVCISTSAQKLTDKVDVFIGTGGHGHTYPGATVPFGMVQLSPDNGVEGWDWCSGYHYSSDSIAGFSHTHLSGTGIGDWADISVMPFTDRNATSVRAKFSHRNELAKPGYYKVQLDNGIGCEMTATERNGYHRYTFPQGSDAWLQFDLSFRINWDNPTATFLNLLNDSTLVGYRFSTGWAKGQKVYFAARFSKPIIEKLFIDSSAQNKASSPFDKAVRAQLRFENSGKPITVRVALSSVSTEKAVAALSETAGQTFDAIATAADLAWEKELQKVKVSATGDFETQFYTALYHTCVAPNLYSDADNSYQTWNGKVPNRYAPKYTVFSLWDTFRGLHPLFTITQPKRLPNMLNSLLSFYEDNGLLPVWDLSTWEANTMTGYHAVPVLADAIIKNVPGVDVQKAYAAMLQSANQQQRGTPEYIRFGYLPQDKHGWSVTITLEYAFDDWCIAQVAKKLGKTADYNRYMQRSRSYQKLFDAQSGFMRAKDSTGEFVQPFDPLLSEHGFEGQYIEGTAWQHSFFVPHDVAGLAKLYGGNDKLIAKLDTLFTTTSELHGENVSADVSGLIGQYAHGNEPSHHIAYMYTVLGQPQKAAQRIRSITDSLYKTGPDGLSGNDDCGQMSAWLVWTALGMYPMNPASGEYVFGFPLLESAQLMLPNGKTLSLRTKKLVANPSRIVSIKLNGKIVPIRSIRHSELLKGGTLEYLLN